MINSQEILIECNMKNSSTSNNINTFTTTIGGGIQLEPGDKIEIASVAVNSKGIGGNMIDIPATQIDTNIASNKITLEIGKYITTGSRFCLPMPHNAYKIIADTTSTSFGYAIETDNSGTIRLPQGNLPYNAAVFGTNFNTFKGAHHYFNNPYSTGNDRTGPNKELGVKLHLVKAPLKTAGQPASSVPPYLQTASLLYDLDRSDCDIEIPFGYETPENIARTITDVFHAGVIDDPNNDLLATTSLYNQRTPLKVSQSTTNGSITNAFIKIASANAINTKIPYSPTTNLIGIYDNPLYDNLYYKKPFRYIYGSRLNTLTSVYERNPPGGTRPANQLINQPVIMATDDLTQWGAITITNFQCQNLFLPDSYEELITPPQGYNIKAIYDFIRNTEEYIALNPTRDYKSESKDWAVYFDVGRYNDETSTTNVFGTGGGGLPLVPEFNAAATGIEQKIGYQARYDEETWNNKKLSAQMITDGYYFMDKITVNNVVITVQDFCRENNIMICLVGNTNDPTVFTETLPSNYLIAFFGNQYSDLPLPANGEQPLQTPPRKIKARYIAIKNLSILSETAIVNNYFGYDFTFMRNTAALAINTSKSTSQWPVANAPNNYVNYIQLGAPNASLTYDEDLGKFAFQDFHFPYFLGDAVSIDVNRSLNRLVESTTTLPTQPLAPFSADQQGSVISTPLYQAYSGATILKAKTYFINTNNFTDPIDIDEDNFKFTLLSRLGFVYDDIFGLGSPEALFTEKSNNFIEYPYSRPSPITTNAKLITTYNYAFGVNYLAPAASSAAAGTILYKPSYDLNISQNQNSSTNAESCLIVATNNPLRLSTPFWLIQSNIIPATNYISDKGKLKNVLSVVNRAYTSNDYAYGMGGSTTKTVENPFVITEITTTIFNNDFTLPKLDNNTVVIYKLTKTYTQENRELQANIQEMEKNNK